jgi:hypothetical protein
MLSWLTDRRIKGSPYALMSQVAGYLGDDRQSKIRVVNSHGVWYTRNADGTLEWYNSGVIDWDWDGDGVTKFSRYWVIVYAVEGVEGTDIWRPDVEWGSDDGVWGDGGVWGAEQVTVEQTTTMRAIIKEWNPPHAQCAGVLVTWEPNAFAPDGFLEAYGAGYPDGTWWRAGAFDTSDYVQTRVQGALFTGPVV